MAKLEFGLRRGLSVPVVRDQSQDKLQAYALQKQAQLEAENRAKMLANDFEYTSAINAFDNKIVNDRARKTIEQLGSFIGANPGWERNVGKRIEYDRLRRELKDNPDINRSLTADASFKELSKYISDPKNADMRDDPALAEILQKRENYLKFGNPDGEEAAQREGYKPFIFIAPEDMVDTNKELIDYAGKVEFDMKNGFGRGGYRQSISNQQKQLAAQNLLSSARGKYYRKDYDRYLRNGGDKNKTLEQFTRERMEPYFKSDKIDAGFAPEAIKAPANMTPSLWQQQFMKAARTPGGQVDFNPKAIDATFGNAAGEKNLNDIKDPFGNTLNLGLRRADATGLVDVRKTPNGNLVAEYNAIVRLPITEFQKLGSEYIKAIDEGGITQGITPLTESDENWDIHDEYQQLGFKKYVDANGRRLVEFPIKKMFDPANSSLADNYSNAHNISSRKEDAYSSENKPKQVIQGGYTYTLNEQTGQYE